MKSIKQKITGVLTLTLLVVMALSLAACQKATATPAPTATPEPTATPAASDAAVPTPTSYKLDGATTTASGLQYLEITPGTGKAPEYGDIIKMNYSASLPDGTELVNTFTSGEIASTLFDKGALLAGWEEGLNLMKVGGRSKIVIPPDLAFGPEGSGGIPGNSQIIIEMELLSSEPAPTPRMVADDKLTTSSTGLKYYDIKMGDGTEAAANSSVSTTYIIWIKTDTGYDYLGSADSSQPFDFVIDSGDLVFPGWNEGVKGMKPGGERLLVIPPDLALGDQEYEGIPANSTLVMEVGLISASEPQVPTKVSDADYTTTASGLKYYDLVTGSGETPATGQTVVVNYTGWLEDGTMFDTSIGKDPFSFTLGAGNVIKGWDEGVATMKVGTKRQLVIPAALAYGDQGAGSAIPPGATLIFEVELLEIQK